MRLSRCHSKHRREHLCVSVFVTGSLLITIDFLFFFGFLFLLVMLLTETVLV